MSEEDDFGGPLKARSDLVEMLKSCPDNTEAIITIIQNELRDIRDSEAVSRITHAINSVASESGASDSNKENVLYWLTETSPAAREMILVRTIEDLLGIPECRPAALAALSKVSSPENVEMVMEWTKKKILTLNQAVFVLLFPESSAALK
jgi:hypothetical protein